MERVKTLFAQINAKQRLGERLEQIISRRNVRGVAMSSQRTNTKSVSTAKIVSIEWDTPEDVYNLEVEDNHNYAINGGLIVHNCMDETRYLVKTLHIARERRTL